MALASWSSHVTTTQLEAGCWVCMASSFTAAMGPCFSFPPPPLGFVLLLPRYWRLLGYLTDDSLPISLCTLLRHSASMKSRMEIMPSYLTLLNASALASKIALQPLPGPGPGIKVSCDPSLQHLNMFMKFTPTSRTLLSSMPAYILDIQTKISDPRWRSVRCV